MTIARHMWPLCVVWFVIIDFIKAWEANDEMFAHSEPSAPIRARAEQQ